MWLKLYPLEAGVDAVVRKGLFDVCSAPSCIFQRRILISYCFQDDDVLQAVDGTVFFRTRY